MLKLSKRLSKIMKQKTKKPTLKQFTTSSTLVAAAVLMVISAPMSVYADQYDDQIQALQSQLSVYRAQASTIHAQADTLQNALNAISAEKNALQAEIDLNQAKLLQVTADIASNEAKLERQKQSISKTIVQIYVNGSTSPIEMLASSKSVGDYVSEQEIRTSVRNQMKASMDEVKRLRTELDAQKLDVQRILADQDARNGVLAAKEAAQADLVAQTRGEEAAYQSLVTNGNSTISSLRAQQAAAYRSYTSSHQGQMYGAVGNGGYPDVWANAPQDSMGDDWGMYNRECTSYVAWKVSSVGKYVPYWGNVPADATKWPGLASNANIPNSRGLPSEWRAGIAVVWQSGEGMGSMGHVAYVEAINGDGSIEVSQYNVIHGTFNRMHVSQSEASYLTYIYF